MPDLSIRDRVKLLIVGKFGAGVFTREEIKEEWERNYDEQFDGRVLLADYCVNTIAGKDDGEVVECGDKYFLYRIERGKYRLCDPQRDGKWKREGDKMIHIE